MEEDIRKAFIEELLKKIISIDSMANILFLSSYVDSILREENAINYSQATIGPNAFQIKIHNDSLKEACMFKDYSQSYMDIEHKYNKKKKRFGR